MKLLNLILFLAFAGAVQAQEYITISKGCNFDGDENGSEYYSFDPSEEAARIVKQILDGAGGLSHGSIIAKESNVENAVATIVDKRRYILYSTAFLSQNIPTGLQQYAILGSIDCGMNGSCTAIGYGQINVVQGGTYNIQWNNSGYAECTVVLR